MPSHITYWKTILARYSSFLGIACEITPPYYAPLALPSIVPSVSLLPSRLSSKLCVPSGDTGRFDLTGRCLVSCGFASAAFPFPFPFFRFLLLSFASVEANRRLRSAIRKARAARCIELRIFRANRLFSRILFSGFVELPIFLQYNIKQSETKPPDKIGEPENRHRDRNPARLEN